MSRKTQILGWVIFILSALTYALDGLSNHDPLSLIASLLFLLACLVFLIPLLRGGSRR